MLVEPKKDMKKRIRRSPDYGDAAAYACHMVMRSGLITMETEKYKQSEEEIAERLREHRRLIYGRRDESLFASEFADSYVGDGYSY